MAMPKDTRPKKKRTPRRAGAEYRFRIDAYSPATMPMARLAEYMAQLATMLGEPSAVHFERLDAGSTVLVHKIDQEAVPKVKARVVAVRRGEGPPDADRASSMLNKLLRDDNAVGTLSEKRRGAIILRFPGRELQEERFPAIRQEGTIDGRLTRIEGSDETIHLGLEVDSRQMSGCYTSLDVGKRLRHHLFEPVRLFGRGSWSRDADGAWSLNRFRVDAFEALSDAPLSEALSDIRRVAADWRDADYEELDAIRHGPSERKNGGH